MVLSAQAANNRVQASDDGKSWTVNIRNADIQAFISQIADMTGKNFVVDPRVRARDVTVVSTKALSADEVYELFLSVLQVMLPFRQAILSRLFPTLPRSKAICRW